MRHNRSICAAWQQTLQGGMDRHQQEITRNVPRQTMQLVNWSPSLGVEFTVLLILPETLTLC